MESIFAGTTMIDIMIKFGIVGIIFVIWYLSTKNDAKRWEQMRKDESVKAAQVREDEKNKRDSDRIEHMKKWDSMIAQQRDENERLLKSHTAEIDRAFKLLERQTAAIEMQASQLANLNSNITNNQFCPIVRKDSKI